MTQLVYLGIGVTLLFAMSLILSRGDFFSPSLIVCAIFLLSVIFAIRDVIVWKVPERIFTFKATIILLLGVFTFVTAEQFTKVLVDAFYKTTIGVANKRKPNVEVSMVAIHPQGFKKGLMLCMVFLLTSFYCYETYKYSRANGYTGGFDFTAIATFRHANVFDAQNRVETSRFYRFSKYIIDANVVIALWFFINNVFGAKEKIRKNVIYIFVILLSLPTCIINSSRGFILQILGCAVLMVYVTLRRRTGWKHPGKIFGRILLWSSLTLIVALALFYFVQANGLFGRSTNRSLLDHVTMYIGDPILNFYDFIKSPPEKTIYFGQETFAELNNLLVKLHIRDVKYSVQLEYRTIQGHSGNIYTFFRRPYHDFGLFGMCVVTWLTSFIFSWFYYARLYKRIASSKVDRELILYSYFFYIVYLVPMLCQLCNMIYFGMVYFVLFVWVIYDLLRGSNVFKIKAKYKQIKFSI